MLGKFSASFGQYRADGHRASSSNKTIVLVTNHLGDCDAELERSFFLASSVTFDNSTLVATAGSTKANISTVASQYFLFRKCAETDPNLS